MDFSFISVYNSKNIVLSLHIHSMSLNVTIEQVACGFSIAQKQQNNVICMKKNKKLSNDVLMRKSSLHILTDKFHGGAEIVCCAVCF